MRFVLGLDIGTTGCKAMLCRTDGTPVGAGYTEVPLNRPFPGWVERDTEVWWDRAAAAMRRAMSAFPQDGRLLAVGISSANGMVFLDTAGRPTRPAIMQLDIRAARQAQTAGRHIDLDRVAAVTGNRLSAGMSWVPTFWWLDQHEPDKVRQTAWVLSPGAYVAFRLTGQFGIDPSRASTSGLFDIRLRKWSDELVAHLSGWGDRLPPVLAGDEPLGHVAPAAAQATGLPAGTLVTAGLMDTLAGAMAVGRDRPGIDFVILGSVGRYGLVTDQDRFDPCFLNAAGSEPGWWIVMAPVSGAGTGPRWLLGLAEHGGSIEDLDRKAAALPADEGIPLCLPHLEGARAPHWNPALQGAIVQLSVRHRPPHLLKALYEGVVLALGEAINRLGALYAIPDDALPVTGGGARSAVWPQILADRLNRPVISLDQGDAEAAGAALAACRTAIRTGLVSAADAEIRVGSPEAVGRTWQPNPEGVRRLREKTRLFERLQSDMLALTNGEPSFSRNPE